MSKSVTITLNAASFVRPTFVEKDLIKIGGTKRKYGIVKNVDKGYDTTTLTLKSGYKPSPRSRLNNRTVFSKYKGTILKVKDFTT